MLSYLIQRCCLLRLVAGAHIVSSMYNESQKPVETYSIFSKDMPERSSEHSLQGVAEIASGEDTLRPSHSDYLGYRALKGEVALLAVIRANTHRQGKVAELRLELNSGGKKDKNHFAKKIALKKIVANMTMSNNDMVALFPDVVGCMQIPSLEIKKMCMLLRYCRLANQC